MPGTIGVACTTWGVNGTVLLGRAGWPGSNEALASRRATPYDRSMKNRLPSRSTYVWLGCAPRSPPGMRGICQVVIVPVRRSSMRTNPSLAAPRGPGSPQKMRSSSGVSGVSLVSIVTNRGSPWSAGGEVEPGPGVAAGIASGRVEGRHQADHVAGAELGEIDRGLPGLVAHDDIDPVRPDDALAGGTGGRSWPSSRRESRGR